MFRDEGGIARKVREGWNLEALSGLHDVQVEQTGKLAVCEVRYSGIELMSRSGLNTSLVRVSE